MKYKVGNGDPAVYRDKGSGAWNTDPKTAKFIAMKVFMLGVTVHGMPNATKHLKHYLLNSGADLQVDLANMVTEVPMAKDNLNLELKAAKEYGQTLKPGDWQITSSETSKGYNMPNESKDWYYAVGAYEVWGKATVHVPAEDAKPRTYSMDFELCFFDRYNWNGGGSVTVGGMTVSDEMMGTFHKQGLAKEYDMRGTYRTSITWTPGAEAVVVSQDMPPRENYMQRAGVGRAFGL